MRMHDLASKYDSPSPLKSSPKGPQYHQSVTIRGAKDLAKHPVGKRLKFHAVGVIDRHSQDTTAEGARTTTDVKLHQIGVAGEAKPTAGRMWCPKCGNTGSGKYCAECGERTVAAKGQDKTSDEDTDD